MKILTVEFWTYSELRSESNLQYYTGGKTLNTLCDGTVLTLRQTLEALRRVYGPTTYIRAASEFNSEEEGLLKEALKYGQGYYNLSRRHCLPVCEITWSYYKDHREWEEEELSHTWHPQIGAAKENNNVWLLQLRSSSQYGPISLEMANVNGVKYLHSEDEIYISSSLDKLKRELTRFELEYKHIRKEDMFSPAISCPVQIISSKKLLRLLDRKLSGSWR